MPVVGQPVKSSLGLKLKLPKVDQEELERECTANAQWAHFGSLCELEARIRERLSALGCNVDDSDFGDGTLHRFFTFDSLKAVERCLAILTPLNKELAQYEGEWECLPVRNDPFMVYVPVVSLWAVAKYLDNIVDTFA